MKKMLAFVFPGLVFISVLATSTGCVVRPGGPGYHHHHHGHRW